MFHKLKTLFFKDNSNVQDEKKVDPRSTKHINIYFLDLTYKNQDNYIATLATSSSLLGDYSNLYLQGKIYKLIPTKAKPPHQKSLVMMDAFEMIESDRKAYEKEIRTNAHAFALCPNSVKDLQEFITIIKPEEIPDRKVFIFLKSDVPQEEADKLKRHAELMGILVLPAPTEQNIKSVLKDMHILFLSPAQKELKLFFQTKNNFPNGIIDIMTEYVKEDDEEKKDINSQSSGRSKLK